MEPGHPACSPSLYSLEKFKTNSDIHSIHSRHKLDFDMSVANFSMYHDGVYPTGIKIFSNLPIVIKRLIHDIEV
jgi:hypothetical protein